MNDPRIERLVAQAAFAAALRGATFRRLTPRLFFSAGVDPAALRTSGALAPDLHQNARALWAAAERLDLTAALWAERAADVRRDGHALGGHA